MFSKNFYLYCRTETIIWIVVGFYMPYKIIKLGGEEKKRERKERKCKGERERETEWVREIKIRKKMIE